jgi:hypothetical protein
MQLRCAVSDPVNLEILPRVAAARRLTSLEEGEAGDLAEQYQLVSRHTSFVVVQVRAEGEKAGTLPELEAVGQMLAAGWGATGSVQDFDLGVRCQSQPMVARSEDPHAGRYGGDRGMSRASIFPEKLEEVDVPEFLRRQADRIPPCSPQDLLAALACHVADGNPWPTTLTELEELGLPEDLLEQLADLVHSGGHDEALLVRVCIAILARSAAGASLSTEDRAALEGTVMTDRDLRSVRAAVQPLVANVTATSWEALLSREEQEL